MAPTTSHKQQLPGRAALGFPHGRLQSPESIPSASPSMLGSQAVWNRAGPHQAAGHRHVYLIQPTGLKYNVSERSMLAVSGDRKWRTLVLSFQNLLCGLWAIWLHLACQGWLLYFLLFPFDSVKPVPHRPTTIQCLAYYACHVLTHLGLLLSHFPQHPTEMPSSSHSSSFGPVFKAQFSPAS